MATLQELRAKRDRIALEIRDLANKPGITPGEDMHLDRLTKGLANIDTELADIEARAARIEAAKATITETASGIDTATMESFNVIRSSSTRDVFESNSYDSRDRTYNALRALDVTADASEQDIKPEIRSLIEKNPAFAETFRATSDPSYVSAFSKLLAKGDAGQALLSMNDQERAAMTRVAQAEQRAAAVSPDSAGGYAIPQLLDPSIKIMNAGSTNPIRNLARIVTGVSDVWTGVASAGVTSSWDAEGVAVSDDTPVLTQPSVTAHKAATFIPYSIEIGEDFVEFAREMALLIADGKDRLEATAFATGSGSGQPYGILTRLDANTNAEVSVTTDGAFGAVDVLNVFAQLGSKYRSNASWIMSLDALNEVRSFSNSTALGAQVVNLQSDYAFQLLGRPVYEASDFPNFTGTTGAANICVVGDFSNFVIFDRVGSGRVELVPHLFDVTNNRPTGQRGLYAHYRVGADLIAPSATEPGFRLLQNT